MGLCTYAIAKSDCDEFAIKGKICGNAEFCGKTNICGKTIDLGKMMDLQ